MTGTLLSPIIEMPDNLTRISVDKYQRMVASGAFDEDDPIELLEEVLVNKMPKDPSHADTLSQLNDLLSSLIRPVWQIRLQDPITLLDSMPEPDVAVALSGPRRYTAHHPNPREIGLLIEVANSSLLIDRITKKRIYARAGIDQYWIVNLADRQVEVYTDPDPSLSPPDFARKQIYRGGDFINLLLRNEPFGQIAVSDILPPP